MLGALVLGSGFAALAGLVATGSVSGVDAYVVRHWMPGLSPADAAGEASLTGALVPFYGLHGPSALDLATPIVTLPAYVLVSTALLAGGLWLLARRESIAAAAPWAVAFVAGNVVEVVSKALLARPDLTQPTAAGLVHLSVFDSSYPSGHALRACLVAALAVRLWPRVWPPAALWVAAGLVLLVAAGAHTLTDVAGGALLAGFLVAAVGARPTWSRSGGEAGGA